MVTKRFHLTKEHLKLLQHFCVDWDDCEFGAPAIDCKRPYGNSGVHQDMIEILDFDELKPGIFQFCLGDRTWLLKGESKRDLYLEGEDERALLDALSNLHRETEIALQICLSTQSFRPGWYEEKDYGDWELIAENVP